MILRFGIRDKKTSLRQTFTGKFFGPIRHGTLTPNTDPDFEKVQAAVRGGSDVAGLRDDQGMINEHGNQPGKIQIGKHGDYFSYKNLKFAQEERKRQREYDATHPRNLDKHLGSQMKSNKIEGDADVRIKVGAEQRQKKRQMFVNHVKQARANPQSPAHEGTGQTTASYEE